MVKPELIANNTCCKETKTQSDQLEFYLPMLQFIDKPGLKTIFQRKPYITCTCGSLNLPNVRGFNLDTGGCISAKV